MTKLPDKAPRSDLLLYQTEDGRTRIQVRMENETVWLMQKLMADLFQKDVRTINEHIRNIYEDGELSPEATIRKFRIVQKHAGKISHEAAIEKARNEYEKFRKQMLEEPTPVERHFIEAIREVKKLEKGKPASAKKKRKISGGRKSRAAKESRINLDGKDL
jgi:hypothetical protein